MMPGIQVLVITILPTANKPRVVPHFVTPLRDEDGGVWLDGDMVKRKCNLKNETRFDRPDGGCGMTHPATSPWPRQNCRCDDKYFKLVDDWKDLGSRGLAEDCRDLVNEGGLNIYDNCGGVKPPLRGREDGSANR